MNSIPGTFPAKVAMKDSTCIGKFTMWPNEEWSIEKAAEGIYLNFYIPTLFDAAKAFGLDVGTGENDCYINMYLNWFPETDKIGLVVCSIAPEAEETYDVEMTEEQYSVLKQVFPEICKKAYGHTPLELFQKERENYPN